MPSTRTDKNQLPKTGQLTSYADYDDGFSQDGSPIGPRFVDNGDGTITDRATNLMWVQDPVHMWGAVLEQPKGAWAYKTGYVPGDIVDDDGSPAKHWVCQVGHTSRALDTVFNPSTAYYIGDVFSDSEDEFYRCLRDIPEQTYEEYAAATLYHVGDFVMNSTTGRVCKCLVEHTSLSPETDWATETVYAVNDIVSEVPLSPRKFICKVGHTSGVGTLAADIAAHPTYWQTFVFGPGGLDRDNHIVPYFYMHAEVANFPSWWGPMLAFYDQMVGESWSESAFYAIGDIVQDDVSADYWKCIAPHGSYPTAADTWTTEHSYYFGGFTWAYDDVTDEVYQCNVDHTSGTGTFAADRIAHPSYWTKICDGSATPFSFQRSHFPGNWTGPYTSRPAAYVTVNPTYLEDIGTGYVGTFAGDRAAHPTYWKETFFVDGGGSAVKMLLADAAVACHSLDFAGHADWKLPNLLELLSLFDYENSSAYTPFVCISDVYQSSTSFNDGSVFCVYFTTGAVNSQPGASNLVRPVRHCGLDDLAPRVDSVLPISGTTAGGDAMTITGLRFATTAAVLIGGVPATDIVVVDCTTITCVTPIHAAGAVDVVVTNGDGRSGTLVGGFTYAAP